MKIKSLEEIYLFALPIKVGIKPLFTIQSNFDPAFFFRPFRI